MRRQLIRLLLGRDLFEELREVHRCVRVHPRIAIALARAAATSALRDIDPADPSTWEFTGFSQNGEDGIIDYLCGRLLNPNRYFIEIGAADGLENNTSWLALGRRYGGLMVDSSPSKVAGCLKAFRRLNWALDCAAVLVNRHTIDVVAGLALMPDPDVFSLDVDGIDYYVAVEFLNRGIRPKIFIVEYNSVFGPDRSVSVVYRDEFNRHREHESGYYYGASITAWRRLFGQHGYRFLTVEANGANAFFVDPAAFERSFVDAIRGVSYRENMVHRRESRGNWASQFARIQHLPLVEIPMPAESTPVLQSSSGLDDLSVMSA